MLNTAEKQERLLAVEDVIGTHRAEGIKLDPTVLRLMDRFTEGELTLEHFSAAMDKHADQVLASRKQLAGAA